MSLTGPRLPAELAAALDADAEALTGWEQSPPDVRLLYVEWIDSARSRRMRRAMAADTAAWAKGGHLQRQLQRPTAVDAAMSVAGDGCLMALLRLGL